MGAGRGQAALVGASAGAIFLACSPVVAQSPPTLEPAGEADKGDESGAYRCIAGGTSFSKDSGEARTKGKA